MSDERFDEMMNENNGSSDIYEEQSSSSGTYRMTREDLRDSELYTGRRSAASNDYSYYQQAEERKKNYEEDERFRKPDYHRERRSEKKKAAKGGNFLITSVKAACLAVIFGLVSGGVMVGMNSLAGHSLLADKQGAVAQETIASGDTFDVNVVKVSDQYVQTTPANGVADIVDQVMPSIVAVNTTVQQTGIDWFGRQYTQEGQGAGSGIIMSEADGQLYIMTNYHVVEDSTKVSVQFADGSNAEAEIKGYDKDADIAVVCVDMKNLEQSTKDAIAIAVMGDSDNLRTGESAIAIGNALGYGQSVTTGVISAKSRDVELTDKTMTLIQTSAAINPGNSGGALLNGKGEVIGVNTIKYSETSVESMGFSIPINSALETASKILEQGGNVSASAQGAYLGIRGGTLDEETAAQYNAPAGVYVSSVSEGSAAMRAGLKSGCVITELNGREMKTMEDLQDELSQLSAGQSVTIVAQFPANDGSYYEQELTTILGSKAEMEED